MALLDPFRAGDLHKRYRSNPCVPVIFGSPVCRGLSSLRDFLVTDAVRRGRRPFAGGARGVCLVAMILAVKMLLRFGSPEASSIDGKEKIKS
jgi:hypothetical protein